MKTTAKKRAGRPPFSFRRCGYRNPFFPTYGRHCLILRKCVGQKLPVADPETAELVDAMTEDLSTSYESVSALFRFSEQLATAPSFNDFAHVVLGQLLRLVQGAETCVRLADSAGNLAVFSSLGKPPAGPPPPLSWSPT